MGAGQPQLGLRCRQRIDNLENGDGGLGARGSKHQEMPAGEQTYDWMCQSDKGNRVAPGLYNAILESPRGREITRIAVIP